MSFRSTVTFTDPVKSLVDATARRFGSSFSEAVQHLLRTHPEFASFEKAQAKVLATTTVVENHPKPALVEPAVIRDAGMCPHDVLPGLVCYECHCFYHPNDVCHIHRHAKLPCPGCEAEVVEVDMGPSNDELRALRDR